MTIYLLLFSVIILLWLLIHGQKNDQRISWERCCGIICVILLVLVAALRGSEVGTDTQNYMKDYFRVKNLTYEAVIAMHSNNHGYYLLSKVFADMGFSVQIWFGFVELLFVGVVTKLILRFSKDVALSYIMFLGLEYYAFSLAGLKQTLSMVFVLAAFLYLYESKYIRFFVCMIIGAFFHVTCLVFLLVIGVSMLKRSKILYFILTVTFAVCAVFYSEILHWIMELWGNEQYSGYLEEASEYSPTVLIVQLLVLLASFIYYRQYSKRDEKEANMLYGLTFLGAIMQVFAFEVASAFRLSLYFSIFGILLMPNCICLEKNLKARRIIRVVCALCFVFFFVYTNRNGGSVVPYTFYWNE